MGDISKEKLCDSLKTPLISLDTSVMLYLEPTLDDVHIIGVEFSGIFDEVFKVRCEMQYRLASSDDIELLVFERLKFIEVDENSTEYTMIKENCYKYFENAFENNSCDVILAEEKGKCVGTGIIFYYDSVPSVFNITGKNAYVTNMYVDPEYRRMGIGTAILNQLVKVAEEKDYRIIMLNASEIGKPMYEKMGFVESKNGMILDRRK